MVGQAQAVQESTKVQVPHQDQSTSSLQNLDKNTATIERAEQTRSESSRMRRALSSKEGMRVDPKGNKLPTNNMIAMFKLLFHTSNTLKKVLEAERAENKISNKKWERESENKAQHHKDAASNQWWSSQYQAWASVATMALPLLAERPECAGLADQIKFVAKKFGEMAPAAISYDAESKKSDIDIKMTNTEFRRDSSRMEVEVNKDEMRQLEGAVDQLNNLIHELIRLEGKTYSHESG